MFFDLSLLPALTFTYGQYANPQLPQKVGFFLTLTRFKSQRLSNVIWTAYGTDLLQVVNKITGNVYRQVVHYIPVWYGYLFNTDLETWLKVTAYHLPKGALWAKYELDLAKGIKVLLRTRDRSYEALQIAVSNLPADEDKSGENKTGGQNLLAYNIL